MKKLLLTLSFLTLLLLPVTAQGAGSSQKVLNVYIPANQTIDDNFVRGANTFDIRGKIKGDVIIAGASIDISGQVSGDVLAAASSIKISGEVTGDVRVAGGTVLIDGLVKGNVNIFAGSADFGLDSHVLGDVSLYSGTGNIKGKIDGDLHGGAGSVAVSGQIGENVELRFDGEGKNAPTLTIVSGASIGGNLDYYSQRKAQIDDEASISGEVTRHEPTGVGKTTRKFINSFWWFTNLTSFFGLIIVGLILIWIFEDKVKKVSKRMLIKPGQSMLYGLAILIITPIVSIILMITIIGLPLGIIMLLLYGIAIYISTAFIGVVLGRKILSYLQKKKIEEVSLFWSLILGLLIYTVIVDLILWSGSFLGIFSGLVKFVTLVWALGAMFYFGQKKEGLKKITKK
ncbi:MAG: hypothetical protein U5L76_03920 [Patescibacteria group bacterium]|nr:hypothetical protein [Patescibacteria group bacterium]